LDTIREFVLSGTVRSREPDECIPNPETGEAYLRRWHLWRRAKGVGWSNLYVHEYVGSDLDRALHDHPWASLSLMLTGVLKEIYVRRGKYETRVIQPGRLVYRPATFTHRLELVPSSRDIPRTLFLTGPKVRDWGFWTSRGWVHWRDYLGVGERSDET